MGKRSYSLQRRLQIYVVITILLVAIISSTTTGYIYFRSSLSDFYSQADSTLTYFENAILRQKLRESSSAANSLASLPDAERYLSADIKGGLPASLTQSIDTNSNMVVLMDENYNVLFSSAAYKDLNHNNMVGFLHRRQTRLEGKQVISSTQSRNDPEAGKDDFNNFNSELSTTIIPDDSFYYGDLLGNFLAMSMVPVIKDGNVIGYIMTGYDLTDPAYTEYIGRYFGLVATVFYQDIRVNTNLEDVGANYLHTTMDTDISRRVFIEGQSYSGHVDFAGKSYLGTYRTISDNANTVGALFIGTRISDLLFNLRLSIYLIAAAALVIVIGAILVTRQIISKHIGRPISQTIELLQKMAANPAELADADISYVSEKNLNNMVQSLKHTAATIARDREHLAYLAFHDRLTGFFNSKRLFDYYGERENSSINHTFRAPAIVITVNIDFFKRHKKYLGQQGSEDLLIAVSQRLAEVTKTYNCDLYRLTSDEFIICSDTVFSNETYDQLLVDLMDTMHKPLDISGKKLIVTISIGAARRETSEDSLQDIMQKSSMALDTAKYSGRNQLAHYDPKTAKIRQRYLRIEEKLRGLQDYSCFELYFQPQINIFTGEAYGLEALIRWHDSELGWVSPAEFIPLAEAIGMITPIGYWVTDSAIKFLSHLKQIGITDLHMSINVAAAQLIEPDFVIRTIETARLRGVDPSDIVIEITETQLIQSFENAAENLKLLKRNGFNIAMDDFGTGYSSLSYISSLSIDIIKIDQSFIQSLESDVNLELVREMIALGQRLGMTVISEGVETKAQLLELREINGTYIQGYYISRPLPRSEIISWLKHNSAGSHVISKIMADA